MDLKEFSYKPADWRKIIRFNTHRTKFVIGSFVILYTLLGLVVDLYLNASRYPNADLGQIRWLERWKKLWRRLKDCNSNSSLEVSEQ